MENPKIYPVEYSNDELKQKAAELSSRVIGYDPKAGNGEDLIKDSVLFNVAYIELQNRDNNRVSRIILWLTCVSALVAIASTAVAWFSYKASEENTRWQDQQIQAVSSMSHLLESINENQLKEVEIAQKELQFKVELKNKAIESKKNFPATKP